MAIVFSPYETDSTPTRDIKFSFVALKRPQPKEERDKKDRSEEGKCHPNILAQDASQTGASENRQKKGKVARTGQER